MYYFVTELLHCTQRTKNYSCQPCKNSVNLGCDPSKYRTAYNKILSNLLPKWSMAAPDNDNNLDLVTSDKIKTRCRTWTVNSKNKCLQKILGLNGAASSNNCCWWNEPVAVVNIGRAAIDDEGKYNAKTGGRTYYIPEDERTWKSSYRALFNYKTQLVSSSRSVITDHTKSTHCQWHIKLNARSLVKVWINQIGMMVGREDGSNSRISKRWRSLAHLL